MQEEEGEEKKGSTEEQKGNIVFFLFSPSLSLSHAERSINRSAVAYLIVGFPPSLVLLCRSRTCKQSEEKIKRTSHHHAFLEQFAGDEWPREQQARLNDRNDKM